MRHALAFVTAFCFLGLTVDLVRADKPPLKAAVTKTAPSKMPREKALLIEMANLKAINTQLNYAAAQATLDKLQAEVNEAIVERDSILKEYDIEPSALAHGTVKINSKTGAIDRSQVPPNADKPEKTAVVEHKEKSR